MKKIQMTLHEEVEESKLIMAAAVKYEGFPAYLTERLMRRDHYHDPKVGVGPLVFEHEWNDNSEVHRLVCRAFFKRKTRKIIEIVFSVPRERKHDPGEVLTQAALQVEKRLLALEKESALMKSWGFEEKSPYAFYERVFPRHDKDSYFQVERGADAYSNGVSLHARAFGCQGGDKEGQEQNVRWDPVKGDAAPAAAASYVAVNMTRLKMIVAGTGKIPDLDFLAKFGPSFMSEVLSFKAEEGRGEDD
ncbi:MAG: hypothetical protein J6Y62_01695 [Clostridia bacterium]|nr:hypothetical protein [Clostridia bacterium]